MSENSSWFGQKSNFFKRMKATRSNEFGIISINKQETNVYRDKRLEFLDSYYENRQYDHLLDWETANQKTDEHVPIRQRKPRMKVAFAKTLSQRLAAKLIGQSVFPKFDIIDSPEDTDFIKAVIKETKLKANVIEPFRRMINSGSCFLRHYISGGKVKFEWYSSKYCYPEFQENGELSKVVIRYLFTDKSETDKNGNPKKKWYQIELNTLSEILFDNPEYVEDQEPKFNEVERVDHELGFVQGAWLRVSENSGSSSSPDGISLVEDITDFIDELNYSLSQSSNAIAYNQDPQLTIANMDQDELDNLVRSVTKSWNLGRNGKAEFLESNLSGVERAIEMRDKVKLNIQDITRIVLLDPEKIVGNAQSAKAMEVLHGPLKDLIDELREPTEGMLKQIVLKLALTILIANQKGIEVPIMIPPGYQPTSLDLNVDWPPIFQQTMEDLQKKVQVVSAATTANLISRETGTKFIMKDFNIENLEEEVAKIAAQPIINPFGGF